jgi:hypothetical protein
MATHALRHDHAVLITPRWLIVGFIAGALSVLIFHQGAVALLHALGLVSRAPFSMEPTSPFGVPSLWSIAFWGGVWGMILAAALRRLWGARFIVASTIFGIVFPTLVAWLVVAPLKGRPILAGLVPMAMLIGPIVNGAWGLGTGIGLALFGRSKRRA